MTTCPDCEGKKRLPALVNRGAAGCSWEQIPCVTCRGVGEVSADYSTRREEAKSNGAVLRASRIARGETLLEAARRNGVSVVEYSRLERGVALPGEVGHGADEAALRRAQPEAGEGADEEAVRAAAPAPDGAAAAPGSVGECICTDSDDPNDHRKDCPGWGAR